MTLFLRLHSYNPELFALEHRFPISFAGLALLIAGNVASAILMLIGQG